MTDVLEAKGLVHRYGNTVALDGVDLTVASGECVALLGPHGAGKTTLVRNIIGLIRADEGTVRVAGGDPRFAAVRRRLGIVQQDVGFPRTLRSAPHHGTASRRRQVGYGKRPPVALHFSQRHLTVLRMCLPSL